MEFVAGDQSYSRDNPRGWNVVADCLEKKNPYYFFIFPRRNKNVERKSAVNNSELFRIFEFFFFRVELVLF